MAKTSLLIGFVASLLFVSLIAYSLPAFAQGPDNPGKPDVIAVSGIVPGKNLVVHILLEVPPGADKNNAASVALSNQGARPFTHDEYSTIDLKWDQFSDGVSGNDFVTQNYNPKNEPTSNGLTALQNTYNTWNSVPTSSFTFEYGEQTDRCPSLVDECKGRQSFDGNNDVAWMKLRSSTTLGVTWSGTTIDEADMALNTNYSWNTNDSDIDIETVFLHENGHAAGIGHSDITDAIMQPVYDGLNRKLQQDDINGITFLYPGTSTLTNNSPTVSITSPSNDDSFDSGSLVSFTGTAIDAEDGDITSGLTWISNIDGPIGTGGSLGYSLSDGTHTITAKVTDAGGKTSSTSITITVGTPVDPISGEAVTADVSYRSKNGKGGNLFVDIVLKDSVSETVPDTTVEIQLFLDGSSIGTGTGTTNTDGKISFRLSGASTGTYSTTILKVAGQPWTGTTNDDGFTK